MSETKLPPRDAAESLLADFALAAPGSDYKDGIRARLVAVLVAGFVHLDALSQEAGGVGKDNQPTISRAEYDLLKPPVEVTESNTPVSSVTSGAAGTAASWLSDDELDASLRVLLAERNRRIDSRVEGVPPEVPAPESLPVASVPHDVMPPGVVCRDPQCETCRRAEWAR